MPVKRPPLSDDPDQNIVPDEPIVEDKPDIVMTSRKARAADPTLPQVAAVAPPPPPPPPPPSYGNNTGSSFGGYNSGSNFGSSSGFGSGSSFGSNNSFQSQPAPSAPMNEQEYQMAKARLELEKERMDESWVKQYWRPAMGWLYMAICAADFIIFPALTIFLPVIFKAFGIVIPYVPWKSITLENGGLVHMAFGAILGVAAWTRGQEKIQGKA